jgi:NADH-quinone oxidoreductase subunit D
VTREELSIIKRLSTVGKLSKAEAIEFNAVGPVARASGVDIDTRRDDPYAAYDEVSFKVITDNHEDVYGRTLVRIGELMESYSIIRQVIENMPEGPISVKVPRKIPEGEAFSRYEAPRGEDVHYVKSNGSDKPERVKLRAPTLANIKVMLKMIENYNLADLPIIVAAIDPCFSCTDRMILIENQDTRSSEVMDWKSLRQYSINWYKKRGIKF